MPASDEFKKALRSGDLPEAFVMAMGKATELKITTQVVKADGTIAAEYNPAHALETRLDILNGTIENKVGEEFVGTGKYRELQQFHQQQVALGNRKIQENFQSLQQLFRLLVTLQQYNRITNAEKPLDLTFLEVPSQALPPEKVVTTLQEQAAILETIAEVQSAAGEPVSALDLELNLDGDFGLSEADVTPPATVAPAPTKIKLTAPPPPQVTSVKPSPEPSEASLKEQLAQVAIATGTAAAAAAIISMDNQPSETVQAPTPIDSPKDQEESMGFLDSFAALDLDDTPEPLMPLSDVEMDDWETPVELTPAQRLSQMPSETYVPSLNDFEHDPVVTDDDLGDLLADDDLDDLFEDETTTTFGNDLGEIEGETHIEPVAEEIETVIEATESPFIVNDATDFIGTELPNLADEDFSDLLGEIDDYSVAEIPIAADEDIAFVEPESSDLVDEDFGDLLGEIDDYSVAEMPIAADEDVAFVEPESSDLVDENFGDLLSEIDDHTVAETPIVVDEDIVFVEPESSDLVDEDFGNLLSETDDDTVAEKPITVSEDIAFVETELSGIEGGLDDSALMDFLGQDWRSNPDVAEITSLDEEGSEPVLIQPLTEEELATLEEVEDFEEDWQPLGVVDDSLSSFQELRFGSDEEEEDVSALGDVSLSGDDDFDDDFDDDWQPLESDPTEMSSFALGALTDPDSPHGLLALELDDGVDDDLSLLAMDDSSGAIADSEEETLTITTDLDESDDPLDGFALEDADVDVELAMMEEDADLNFADGESLGSLSDAIDGGDLSMDALADAEMSMDFDNSFDDSLDLSGDDLDLLAEEESMLGVTEPMAIASDDDLESINVLPDPFGEDTNDGLDDDLDTDLAMMVMDDPLGELNLDDGLDTPDFTLDSGENDTTQDDLFSADVLSSIQELDASTANLAAEAFDFNASPILGELTPTVDDNDDLDGADALESPFALDVDLEGLDMDTLALESSLELEDLGDDPSAIAPREIDTIDDTDLDFSGLVEDFSEEEDDFDQPIDLSLDTTITDLPHGETNYYSAPENPIDNDDWAALEPVTPSQEDAHSWDDLQTSSDPSSRSANDPEDWTMDLGDLDVLNNLEDADLSGLGDFDLESIENDDGEDNFDIFGEDNSDSFNPFIDTQA